MKRSPRESAILTSLLLLWASSAHAQVRVVNMIPNAQSGEQSQDSEPNLAVNPANPQQMAGTAFTPDPAGHAKAPIYISLDGGASWTLNSILPGSTANDIINPTPPPTYIQTGTYDITVRFASTSGNLYAAFLRVDYPFSTYPDDFAADVYRTSGPTFTGDMTSIGQFLATSTTAYADQPFVQAATVSAGPDAGKDRIYIGDNDHRNEPKTATVFMSLDAAAGTPAFSTVRMEQAAVSSQDNHQIRPAVHANGTVYIAWFRSTGSSFNLMIARDNNWATAATPFSALTTSGLVGTVAVSGVNVPSAYLGNQRAGGDLAIAVSPQDSNTVYLAYADNPGSGVSNRLHVIRNTSGGSGSWSGDLFTVNNGKNPSLTINTHGRIGLLYQVLTGSGATWETHLRRSSDGTTWTSDLVLQQTPASAAAYVINPYLGDYAYLTSVGNHFYGIFSGSNNPTPSYFPQGVVFQRNVAATPSPHLVDLDGTTTVPLTIDPFFFDVDDQVAGASDFYARDWNDSPTSYDTGVEPSTHADFYNYSDVWNDVNSTPQAFDPVTGRPQGTNPVSGTNYAYARVSHNTASTTSETVTAHFLYAPFGVGSNFIDAGSPTATTVTFTPSDPLTKVTPAHSWDPTAAAGSTHVCLAVEISSPSDPITAPDLLGHAPGWPTSSYPQGSDAMILDDNNKAQRNFSIAGGLAAGPAGGAPSPAWSYALIHNAAVFERDVVLRCDAPKAVKAALAGARLQVVGTRDRQVQLGESATLVLQKMAPGENRWLALGVDGLRGPPGRPLPVGCMEMVNATTAVNGFTFALLPLPPERLIRDNLRAHADLFGRLSRAPGPDQKLGAAEMAAAEALLAQGRETTAAQYLAFLKAHLEALRSLAGRLSHDAGDDAFQLLPSLDLLNKAVAGGAAPAAAGLHASLLQGLDADLTRAQKRAGDPADILQMVIWQDQLYGRRPQLAKLKAHGNVARVSSAFVREYERRQIGNDRYPALITTLLLSYRETAQALPALSLGPAVEAMQAAAARKDLAATEKAHHDYLLKLNALPN